MVQLPPVVESGPIFPKVAKIVGGTIWKSTHPKGPTQNCSAEPSLLKQRYQKHMRKSIRVERSMGGTNICWWFCASHFRRSLEASGGIQKHCARTALEQRGPLQVLSGSFWRMHFLLDVTRCCKILQDITRYYQIWLDIRRYHWILLDIIRYY